MSKSARTVVLLDFLSEGIKTSRQIADKLEVSPRTVKRLIEELTRDFPIGSQEGRNGGYYLLPGASLRSGFLSKDEISLISESLSAYKNADSQMIENLRLKLNSVPHRHNDWMVVDYSQWDSTGTMNNRFKDIKNAILESRQIEFTYFDMYYRKSTRTINPYWLVFKEHSWYVKGFCLLRGDMRTFKLAKMININVLAKKFTVNEALKQNTDIYYNTVFPIVNLVLHVDKKLAAKVYEDFDQQFIQESDEGYLIVECSMFKDDKFIPLLLSYGDDAYIISPNEIHDEIADIIKKMYIKFQKSS